MKETSEETALLPFNSFLKPTGALVGHRRNGSSSYSVGQAYQKIQEHPKAIWYFQKCGTCDPSEMQDKVWWHER